MAIYAAVLDACVMVPVSLCDTLLRLAEQRMFRPAWSARILVEVEAAIATVHPDLDPGLVRRRIEYMNESFPGACVREVAGVDEGLTLPDPNDRHVLVTALRARVDAIVTANVKDFPASTLAHFDLEAIHPDDFLMSQLDMHGRVVLDTLDAQARATRNPALTLDDVLTSLARAEVPDFAEEARRRL